MAKCNSETPKLLSKGFTECWNSLVIFLVSAYNLKGDRLEEYKLFVLALVKNHGDTTTVKVLKDLNGCVRRHVAGAKVERGTLGGIWFDCYQTGIPRRLKYLNHLTIHNPRAAVCITNMYVSLCLPPKFDLTTVESPMTGTITTEEINEFGSWCRRHVGSNTIPIEIKERKFHCSLKGGVNHKIVLFSSYLDAVCIHLMQEIQDRFLAQCESVGYKRLGDLYKGLISKLSETDHKQLFGTKPESDIKSEQDLSLAKLVFLPDKGGKTRVVYVLNWWFQELLHPLHTAIMSWLRSQGQDGTYTQRAAALRVKSWTSEKCPT